MNQLSHRLALPHHTTFNQLLLRSLFFQVFGHEARIETNLIKERICVRLLNIRVYKFTSLKLEHLAKRKLLNPFKYLEFILTFITTLPLWLLLRSMYRAMDAHEEKNTSKIGKAGLYLYIFLINFILYPIFLIMNETLNTIFRIPLAPANFIVRPMIEFAKMKTLLFFLLTTLSLIIGGSLFIGLVTSLSLKIAISIAAFLISDMALTKFSIFLLNVIDMRQTMESDPIEKTEKNDKKTTSHLTHALHGLNPKRTTVLTRDKQNIAYTIALSMGTEGLFYARKNNAKNPTQQNQTSSVAHSSYFPQSKG